MRCEDYPCCGHTPGDPCPDRDRAGRIVPRCCMCNKRLNRSASSSLCGGCQRRASYGDYNSDEARSDDR
jgi:hypothetical protein